VTWYVKAKGSDGSAYTILCQTPKQALGIAADQRGMGRRVWIEDNRQGSRRRLLQTGIGQECPEAPMMRPPTEAA